MGEGVVVVSAVVSFLWQPGEVLEFLLPVDLQNEQLGCTGGKLSQQLRSTRYVRPAHNSLLKNVQCVLSLPAFQKDPKPREKMYIRCSFVIHVVQHIIHATYAMCS